jgi:hypothetical protein
MSLNFRPFFHATYELRMPSFQGISALAGKTLSIAEPSLNPRHHAFRQATGVNLAKKPRCFATYV